MSTRRNFISSTAGLIGAPALLSVGSVNAQTSSATAKFKSHWDAIKNHFPITRTYKYTSAKSIVTLTTSRVKVNQDTNFYEIPYSVAAKKETLNSKGIYETTWFNEFDSYTYINLRSNNSVRSKTFLSRNHVSAVFPGTSLIVSSHAFDAERVVETKEELRRKLQNGWALRTWALLVPLVCYSIPLAWNAKQISRSGFFASPWGGYTEFLGTINGVTDTYRKIYAWDGTQKKWIWALIRVNQSEHPLKLASVMTNLDELRLAVGNMIFASTLGLVSLTASVWEGVRAAWALIYGDDRTQDDWVYAAIIAAVALGSTLSILNYAMTAQNKRMSAVTTINFLIKAAGRGYIEGGYVDAQLDSNGFMHIDNAPIDAHFPFGSETQWATPPQGAANAVAGLILDPPDFVPDPLRIV